MIEKLASRLEEDWESLALYHKRNETEIEGSEPRKMQVYCLMIADSFRAYFYKKGVFAYYFKYKLNPLSKYKISWIRRLDVMTIIKLLKRLGEIENWSQGEDDKKKVHPIHS